MKDKITKKDKCFIIILTILFISFILNCYQVIVNKRYKRIIESTCYGNVEEIRMKNESVLSILESSIKAASITNDELLTLYKNYSAIANAETELLEYYLEYKDNPSIKTSKNDVSITNENVNEMYWEIEEVIYSYIKGDLIEKSEAMKISGKVLDDFNVLKEMSEKLNQYYISFYDDNFAKLDEEKRADEIISNAYWLDILNQLQNITMKYLDYEFSTENP